MLPLSDDKQTDIIDSSNTTYKINPILDLNLSCARNYQKQDFMV